MLSSILKLVSGATGPYLLYAVAAVILGLSSALGVEYVRLQHAHAELAQALADKQVCESNNKQLIGAVAQANAEADAAKAAAQKVQADDAARAKRRLATPFVPTAPGADSFNRWLDAKP